MRTKTNKDSVYGSTCMGNDMGNGAASFDVAYQEFQAARLVFEPLDQELRELTERWGKARATYEAKHSILQRLIDTERAPPPIEPERLKQEAHERKAALPGAPVPKAPPSLRPRGGLQIQILTIANRANGPVRSRDLELATGAVGAPKQARRLCKRGLLSRAPDARGFLITEAGRARLAEPESVALQRSV